MAVFFASSGELLLTTVDDNSDKRVVFRPVLFVSFFCWQELFHGSRHQNKVATGKGEEPTFSLNYHEIHSAKATDSAEAATPEFKAYAASYIASVEALKSANSDEVPLFYPGMVN